MAHFRHFLLFFDFLPSPASLKKEKKKVNQCPGYPSLNYLEEIQLSIVWLKKRTMTKTDVIMNQIIAYTLYRYQNLNFVCVHLELSKANML